MTITNIIVPDLPESITDATVVIWHKKIGDQVFYDDNLVDIETDKVMLAVPSPCNGILSNILEKTGTIVQSQQILGCIENIQEKKKDIFNNIKKDEKLSVKKENNYINNNIQPIPSFTPSIRRLIHSHKINLDKTNDLITNEDIKNYIKTKKNKKTIDISNNTVSIIKKIKKNNIELNNRVKMTRLRQKISERLLDTIHNTAMLTTFNEVNMKPIILLRKKYGEDFKKKNGIRLGFMSFYVKAVVAALKKFPEVNASIDNKDIIYYKNFDISIAISTPRGLITPVLRNADTMSMSSIEKKIKEFSIKGLEKTITIEELTGGSFTITNGGVFGSLMSTPIINPPQTAILGMHVIKDRPMAIDGKIKILPMMYLALSYDHRLIDGKESVSFLLTIKNILEDFTSLLIDM
ncbi:dihydrolipoyllysine-residue succinyltransferase [Buchnera aphidicola]|uniref:dihydrolipoyllysine-residue succinyltransferase n=1 Tax=Buchnera aphidicola TaxID=9 RepID=UPI003BEF1886